MKKIEDINFDKDDIISKYQKEIDEINRLYKELNNDKSIQKLYKKYLKKKEKFNKIKMKGINRNGKEKR